MRSFTKIAVELVSQCALATSYPCPPALTGRALPTPRSAGRRLGQLSVLGNTKISALAAARERALQGRTASDDRTVRASATRRVRVGQPPWAAPPPPRHRPTLRKLWRPNEPLIGRSRASPTSSGLVLRNSGSMKILRPSDASVESHVSMVLIGRHTGEICPKASCFASEEREARP